MSADEKGNEVGKPKQKFVNYLKPGWAIILFTLTMIVMIGHEGEHVVQVYQKWNGAACPFDCRGLMGSVFDLEWVHFVYNFSVFVALVICWLGLRFWRPEVRLAHPFYWWNLTLGIFVIQGYHVIEHAAKIGQWLINGHQSPTPGLLGALMPPPTPGSFSLIEMHFAINTIVTVMVTIGYLGFRVFRELPESLKIRPDRKGQSAALIILAIILATGAFFLTNKLLHQGHSNHQGSVISQKM
jgi:hypothetical protein